MSRPPPSTRADYRYFHGISTRWADNDVFGHVNNVVYYAWIDTAVNRFLIGVGALDLKTSRVVGVVAETGCRFLSEIAYPDDVSVGIRIARLGRSSVRYEIGVFRADDQSASAEGHFVHVYVDRGTMRPVEIPGPIRAALQKIMIEEEA
jgi:acyl-CoA thioester hydrolase